VDIGLLLWQSAWSVGPDHGSDNIENGKIVGDFGKLMRVKSLPAPQNHTFFSDASPRPLGRLTMAGTITRSRGTDPHRLRVFGQYAIVLLLHGGGSFRDALGFRAQVRAGDLIFIFPEVAHRYGPVRGDDWDEIYVSFDGPVFDLWRHERLLDPARPITSVTDWHDFARRLEAILQEPRLTTVPQHLAQLHRFMALLGEVTTLSDSDTPAADALWLSRAKALLQSNLGSELRGADVAREVGLTYESFRKSFTKATGVSPAQYRSLRRMEAAKSLLAHHDMTHEAIARSLGFRDAAHLARRFKEISGETPRGFRKQIEITSQS
jgi:AraC-like DNA-binding protein